MNLQRLTGTSSDCKNGVSKRRNSKRELTRERERERETWLKALGKRKPKSNKKYLCTAQHFPIILWLWVSLYLRWLPFICPEHSRLFAIWILWCRATESSSVGRLWWLPPLTNHSSQLTFCSVTSWSNRVKTNQKVQKLFGRGGEGRETHTERLQEGSFF